MLSSPASDDERVGAGACGLEPVDPEISVTGFAGAAQAPVQGGGWQLTRPDPDRLDRGQLSFWLDFPQGTARCSPDGDACNVWGLAPGVELKGLDVDLPAGRVYFETDVWDDGVLEQMNKRFIDARSAAWRAKEEVTSMERAKDPAPVWSAEKNAWVVERVQRLRVRTAEAARARPGGGRAGRGRRAAAEARGAVARGRALA